VIVVSAPGGSGKTLSLADWVRSGDGPETAWISLDVDDNDPRRLWAAVVTALLALPSVAADHRLQELLTDVTRKRNRDVVDALAAALNIPDPPVRLVLDDVHALIGTQVLRDLARLVRRVAAMLNSHSARRTWTVDVRELSVADHAGPRAIGRTYRRALRHDRRITLQVASPALQSALTRVHLVHHVRGEDGPPIAGGPTDP